MKRHRGVFFVCKMPKLILQCFFLAPAIIRNAFSGIFFVQKIADLGLGVWGHF